MSENQPIDEPAASAEQPPDQRLYVVEDEWQAAVKQTSDRDRCYAQNPGEDFFHLILKGEIYLFRGHEKFCLSCATRHGLVTTDRLFWQNAPKKLGRERFV